MRRGKPPQQIYTPGSGPLKRSGTENNAVVAENNFESYENKEYIHNSSSRYHKRSNTTHLDNRQLSADIDNVTDQLHDLSVIRDTDTNRRKPKKPEQTYYVPKPIAQARENTATCINDDVTNTSEYINGNEPNERSYNSMNRSKRYSQKRRTSKDPSFEPSQFNNKRIWRANASPVREAVPRQGSEPRATLYHDDNNRNVRDTRSVEPTIVQTKGVGNSNHQHHHQHHYGGASNKPPSGRRHSSVGVEFEKRKPINLESLPPRFQKKYLEGNHASSNYIGTHTDGTWDGTSLVFQGTSQNSSQSSSSKYTQRNYTSQVSSASVSPLLSDQQPHSLQSYHHQHPQQHSSPNSYQNYYTLPKGGRGRSSRKPNDIGCPIGGTFHTNATFDPYQSYSHQETRSVESIPNELSSSRPSTPVNRFNASSKNEQYRQQPRDRNTINLPQQLPSRELYQDLKKSPEFSSQEQQQQQQKQLRIPPANNESTFRPSLEAQLSPVSPATPPTEELTTKKAIKETTMILDWSEEVELQVRLEAEEALSDTITRSSSVTSLVDPSTISSSHIPDRKRHKRNNSKARDNSVDKTHYPSSKHRDNNHHNQNYHRNNNRSNNSNNDIDSNRTSDNFKVPHGRPRRRNNSQHDNRSRNASRESSYDRSVYHEPENWREEILRSRRNSERESVVDLRDINVTGTRKAPGIIVLPNNTNKDTTVISGSSNNGSHMERPKYPDIKHFVSCNPGSSQQQQQQHQKSLFNHNNPRKPIIVESNSSRVSVPGFSESSKEDGGSSSALPPQLGTDQFGNVRPNWYDETSESFKMCKYPSLLRDVRQAAHELQNIYDRGDVLVSWSKVDTFRRFLMESLQYLLCKDLKFCQSENVEQFFWKMLYHNIIEMMRKATTSDPANKSRYKIFVLSMIDEGNKYFENLLELLEEAYKFKLTDYLGYKNLVHQKGLGFIGLCLVSAQKIFLYLGDLGRYKEIVNETTNYGKCRQWYVKALELNPKNGKPYNQLAILAVYAKRKLDAVYYYMRSLMSSNPVPSAKEFLNTVIDENRKKYEQSERKRREERLEKARQHMKIKESESTDLPSSLRREIWVRPDGGRRVHRTTSAVQEPKPLDSEEEDLAALTPLEVNKRFNTSYLHVHGKLITRIGMESFQEAALQMLKEFRALLQHTPMPLNCNKFLQLLALNMFAIESTQLKDPQLQGAGGYRSEFQERALVVSLQMFNLILERSVALLHEPLVSAKTTHLERGDSLDTGNAGGAASTSDDIPLASLHPDFLTLLPAIKIWSDWMLCHSGVWNPPPSTLDYRVGPPGDAWNRLATLVNQLEKLDREVSSSFIGEPREGYELVRLPEDFTLYGFTPLMYNEHEPSYGPADIDTEMAQLALRLSKVHFFGTVFLCGLDPPVLKLEIDNDFSEYISVVRTSSNPDSPSSPPELIDDDDLLVESFSEDEACEEALRNVAAPANNESASSEVRQLLSRKVELEKRQRTQELHRQRVQKILQQSTVSVQIEIRPKIVVPDTNCFIDYLELIKCMVDAHVYTLMVPLIVLNELEGLRRGGKFVAPNPKHANVDPQHVAKVAEAAKQALEYLGRRHNNIKCVTTKGTTLPTFTFTIEDDDCTLKNDDKILATCLTLCKSNSGSALPLNEHHTLAEGEPKKLYREVVLLTEDRNLRVKALARDLPVRELPDFMKWAGLG